MFKKLALVLGALIILLGAFIGWAILRPLHQLAREISPSGAAEDYALQNDTSFETPEPEAWESKPFNPLKNVYWGDVHVHTVESMDAVLFGTTATVEDAYRFAKGEKLRSPGGELMQLARPLDFVAITDHAEGFGLRARCGEDDLSFVEGLTCWFMETPNVATFVVLRGGRGEGDAVEGPETPPGVYRNQTRDRNSRASLPICSPEYGGAEVAFMRHLIDDLENPARLLLEA